MILSLVTFILVDNYNIPDGELANQMGMIGTVAEAICILEGFFLGFVFDHFGRKWPIVIAFVILGASVILIPVFNKIEYYYYQH